MVNISEWMDMFLAVLQKTFPMRVWFVGLQGSYARGEATETSDIDVVVILDELNAADIQKYSAMLDGLPERALVCGFLAGKAELLAWEPSDLFPFCHDTKPLQGSLDGLLSLLDDAAVARAIRIGAGNIYHGCVHNMIHEKSEEILKGLYKAAVFTVQAVVYRQTGRYIRKRAELLRVAEPAEGAILEGLFSLKGGTDVDFDKLSELLFAWTQGLLCMDI